MSITRWLIGTLSAAGALAGVAWLGWVGGQDACRAEREEVVRQRDIAETAQVLDRDMAELARVAVEACREGK